MNAYYIIFITTIIIYFLGKNKLIYWLGFVILFLFMAFRDYSVGGDSYDYMYSFLDVGTSPITNHWHISPIEFSFYALNWIVYNFIGPFPRIFFIISSFITLFPIFYYTKKHFSNYYKILAFYVLLYQYFFAYCFIMQYIAITILYIAFIQFAINKNIKRLIIGILFATSFHSSSIVCLAIFPFLKYKITTSQLSWFAILSYILGRGGFLGLFLQLVGLNSIYNDRYTVSFENNFTLNGLLVTLYFVFLLNYLKIEKLYTLLYGIGIIGMNLLSFNGDIARIAWDFSIFGIIVLAHSQVKEGYNKLKLPIILISLIFGILVYFSFLFDNQAKLNEYIFSLQ